MILYATDVFRKVGAALLQRTPKYLSSGNTEPQNIRVESENAGIETYRYSDVPLFQHLFTLVRLSN